MRASDNIVAGFYPVEYFNGFIYPCYNAPHHIHRSFFIIFHFHYCKILDYEIILISLIAYHFLYDDGFN